MQGVLIKYSKSEMIKDQYGILSGIGYDEDDHEVWIAFYPKENESEDDFWAIERYMRNANDWRDYCYHLERIINKSY